MVLDDNAYGDNIKNMLKDYFEHLHKEVSYVQAVSLIDLPAWEKAYYNDFRNPEAPAFLYGNFDRDVLIESGLTPQDLYSIEHNESFSFKYKGKDTTIFMISAGNEDQQHLIAILLNDEDTKIFTRYALTRFAGLLIFTLAVILAGIFYTVHRHRALLTLQAQRNEEIERFTKNVAMIPEITYVCTLQAGELLLTYNYGKLMHQDHEVSLQSIYRPMREIYSDEYVNEFKDQVRPVFEGKSKRFEITYKDDHYEHFVSPILDKDGNVAEIIGIATNITDRRLEEEKAKHFATHDFLTDLTNRRSFEEEANKLLSCKGCNTYAALIIDLDGFKTVNDTFGHAFGDAVLKQVALRIKNTVTERFPTAIVARMGGDEFAVLTPYEQAQDIADMAKNLVAAAARPYQHQGESIGLEASVGISLYSADSSTYGQLLYYADMAMYHAKNQGGGRYQFFS